MRLENCNLDVKHVVSAPLQRSEPEPIWMKARQDCLVPEAVFALYARANYLSFGSAPPLLRDDANVLFSYYGMLLNSLRESLTDADQQLRLLVDAQTLIYDPVKKKRGQPWDPSAAERARWHFKNFLISLESSLDAFADLVALFFTGMVPGLRVGRARFVRIDRWLSKPLREGGILVAPQEHFLRNLHGSLGTLVHARDPEREWLPLMRLYRNKAAHLNDAVFRYVGLQDKAGDVHIFLPRQWPYIPERFMALPGSKTPTNPIPFPDLCRATLMRQDIVTYTRGLREKVLEVLGTGASVVLAAYDQLKDLPFNGAALAEIEKSTEAYSFQYFRTTG